MILKWVLLAVYGYCTLLENLFCVTYFFGSPWRSTVLGRNFMAYSACVAGISDLILAAAWLRFTGWLVAVGYVLLGVAVTFRYVLLLRAQHGGRLERNRRSGGL